MQQQKHKSFESKKIITGKVSSGSRPSGIKTVDYKAMFPTEEGSSNSNESKSITSDQFASEQYNDRLKHLKDELNKVLNRASRNSLYIKKHPTVTSIRVKIDTCQSGSLLHSEITKITKELPSYQIGRILGRGSLINLNYALQDVLYKNPITQMIAGDTDAAKKSKNMSNRYLSNRLNEVTVDLRNKDDLLSQTKTALDNANNALNENKFALEASQLKIIELSKKGEELNTAQTALNELNEENKLLKAATGNLEIQQEYILENEKLKKENATLQQQNQFLRREINKLQKDLDDLKRDMPFKTIDDFREYEKINNEVVRKNLRCEIKKEFQEILEEKNNEISKIKIKLDEQEKDNLADREILSELIKDKRERDADKLNKTQPKPIKQGNNQQTMYGASSGQNPTKSHGSVGMFGMSFGGRK